MLALCAGNSLVIGEFSSQGASDAELWRFFWSTPEQTVKQTVDAPEIRDVIALIMTSLWWLHLTKQIIIPREFPQHFDDFIIMLLN